MQLHNGCHVVRGEYVVEPRLVPYVLRASGSKLPSEFPHVDG